MKVKTCAISNCGLISQRKLEKVVKKLRNEIDNLIAQGVTEFISSGDIGFDQMAAAFVLDRKKHNANIRLKFALPCRNQDEKWGEKQKQLYHFLLNEADEVVYLSNKQSPNSMTERVNYMVDNSAYVLCASISELLRYSYREGLSVIKVA